MTHPDPDDVATLTELLDLTANFDSTEQRARYLLSSDWMRDRDNAGRDARDEDEINTARWMAGCIDSPDRLRAFEAIRAMQQPRSSALDRLREFGPIGSATRSTGPHLHFAAPAWDGASPVVDNEGDYWDREADGSYRERINHGLVMSPSHLEARYGPVKPIAWPADRDEVPA